MNIKNIVNQNNTTIIDVREPSEFASGHAKGAINIPLGLLVKRKDAARTFNHKPTGANNDGFRRTNVLRNDYRRRVSTSAFKCSRCGVSVFTYGNSGCVFNGLGCGNLTISGLTTEGTQ